MRVTCQSLGPVIGDPNREKERIVKQFIEYLLSDKHSRNKDRHGHCAKFERSFGRHGFGKHHHGHGMHRGHHGPRSHGHHGPGHHGLHRHHGPHSHHGSHGYHGPHGHHGPLGHHGPYGHYGPHGHHGRQCHRGHPGFHGPNSKKLWTKWTIDLTCEDSSDSSDNATESGRNPSPPPNEAGTSTQEQQAENSCKCSRFRRHGGRFGRKKFQKRNPVPENSSQTDDHNMEEVQDDLNEGGATTQEQQPETNKNNCKCSRFGRHGGRFGRKKCQKRDQVAENSSQTDDQNMEEVQDNLTEMVENVNIENAE